MEPGETRLGLIVPSSNTNAEPLTAAMLRGLRVCAVASRFALPTDLGTDIDERVLGPAADLLAEAGLAALAFHGTSGSWLGLEHDRALAAGLQHRTGVPTTTASIALVDGVRALGLRRIGLVFPGPTSIADGIAAEYATVGLQVVSRSLPPEPLTNPQISDLPGADICRLIADARTDDTEVLVCVGTNLRAAYVVAELEKRLRLPIVDSATATVWQLLDLAGVRERPQGWGNLLSEPAYARQ